MRRVGSHFDQQRVVQYGGQPSTAARCSPGVIAAIAAVTIVVLVPWLSSPLPPAGDDAGLTSDAENAADGDVRISAKGAHAGRHGHRWPGSFRLSANDSANVWSPTPQRCRDPGLPSLATVSVVNVTYPAADKGDPLRLIACHNLSVDLVCQHVQEHGVWEKRHVDIVVHALASLKQRRSVLRAEAFRRENAIGRLTFDDDVEYIDIGANVGALAYSVHLAGFDVTAFEAMPANAQLLSMSKCLNRLRPMMVAPVYRKPISARLYPSRGRGASPTSPPGGDHAAGGATTAPAGGANASKTKFRFDRRDRVTALFNGGVAKTPEELAWMRSVAPTPSHKAKFHIVNAALGNATAVKRRDANGDDEDDEDSTSSRDDPSKCTLVSEKSNVGDAMLICRNKSRVDELLANGYEVRARVHLATLDSFVSLWNHTVGSHERHRRQASRSSNQPFNASNELARRAYFREVLAQRRRAGNLSAQLLKEQMRKLGDHGGVSDQKPDQSTTTSADQNREDTQQPQTMARKQLLQQAMIGGNSDSRKLSNMERAAAVAEAAKQQQQKPSGLPLPSVADKASVRGPLDRVKRNRVTLAQMAKPKPTTPPAHHLFADKNLSLEALEAKYGPQVTKMPIDLSKRDYVVKLDVEGFEPSILQGATEFLSNPSTRPKIMLCEVWIGINVTDFLIGMMAKYGYRVYHPDGYYWIDQPQHVHDFYWTFLSTKWKVVDVVVFVHPGYEWLLPDEDQLPALSSKLRRFSDRYAVGYYKARS